MKKYFFFMLACLLLVSSVSAFYPKSHIKWGIDGFNEVSSTTTDMCRPYLNIILDGNSGSDIGVLHYGSNNALITSYIFTHQLSGYYSCMEKAGSDTELRCECVGEYLHIIQDSYSHLKDGVVEKNLRKYFGSNYYGHMAVERSFENQHLKVMKNNNAYAYSSGKLDYYDKHFLDTFFEKDKNGNMIPSKFLNLMSEVAQTDMSADAIRVKDGYQSEGFYNTVYKTRQGNPLNALPGWAWGLPIVLILLGLIFSFITLLFGNTWWKYIAILTWIPLILLGILLIYSYNPCFTSSTCLWDVTGMKLPTWQMINFVVEFPTHFGYLSVSYDDTAYYDKIIQKATDDFLKDPIQFIENQPIRDASGLSYIDPKTGQTISGALDQAEFPFKLIFYGLFIPVYFLFELWLILKSFNLKFARRRWWNPLSYFNHK